MEDDTEFKRGTQELQTVDFSDFLDPFLPFEPQKKYIYTSRYQSTSKKALTAEWGMLKDLPTLAIRAKLADLGLDCFVRGDAIWEGEHMLD